MVLPPPLPLARASPLGLSSLLSTPSGVLDEQIRDAAISAAFGLPRSITIPPSEHAKAMAELADAAAAVTAAAARAGAGPGLGPRPPLGPFTGTSGSQGPGAVPRVASATSAGNQSAGSGHMPPPPPVAVPPAASGPVPGPALNPIERGRPRLPRSASSRAEAMKEKNRRAQQRFRQRQKGRVEHLQAEVARLRALLKEHGVDPGDPPPELGTRR